MYCGTGKWRLEKQTDSFRIQSKRWAQKGKQHEKHLHWFVLCFKISRQSVVVLNKDHNVFVFVWVCVLQS